MGKQGPIGPVEKINRAVDKKHGCQLTHQECVELREKLDQLWKVAHAADGFIHAIEFLSELEDT
tara:strand:- start:2880 stop:3071 length:192 start_codon:yes stop_codon:yes gene_type:complete